MNRAPVNSRRFLFSSLHSTPLNGRGFIEQFAPGTCCSRKTYLFNADVAE
jgi:hypothetical protein